MRCVRSMPKPHCPKALKLSLFLPFTKKKRTQQKCILQKGRGERLLHALHSLKSIIASSSWGICWVKRKWQSFYQEYLSSFKTFNFIEVTAVDSSHRSNRTKSPGGAFWSHSSGPIRFSRGRISTPNSESLSDMWLNGKAFSAVAAVFHCWV